MYPIDNIKVCCFMIHQLIGQSAHSLARQTRMQIVNPSPSAIYTGIFNGIGRVSSQEGVRTLWKGISSVALGAGRLRDIE
jgi:hypothetical protein